MQMSALDFKLGLRRYRGLWAHDRGRTLCGDPNVIGRELRLDRVYATIVGVMPERFASPVAHRLWLPLPADQASASASRSAPMHAAPSASAY
jgi:hypothetical protein